MLKASSPPNIKVTHPAKGEIQVIFGPMFSGKTTELIRRCRRYQLANYGCVVVKYANDDRYTDENVQQAAVATHDRQTLSALSALKLEDVFARLIDFEVIGIDEGQFFADVVSVAERLANLGKTVVISALDGDFRREGFGSILELVPKAETVVKLTAVCMRCFGDASYTKRISNDTELEVIGGSEKYLAVCRQCYHLDVGDSPRKEVASQTPVKMDKPPIYPARNLVCKDFCVTPEKQLSH